MPADAGWTDWLLIFGQGALIVLFFAFFYLVIRLWYHLAHSGCAYNSPQSPDDAPGHEAESVGESKKPFADQGNRT